MSLSDLFLKDILTSTKTIAMVGLSMNETRPSYFVGRYLHRRGYKIIPINSGHGGKHFFGQLVKSNIDEIDENTIILFGSLDPITTNKLTYSYIVTSNSNDVLTDKFVTNCKKPITENYPQKFDNPLYI